MSEKVYQHREVWAKKKILRDIYGEWYRMIIHDLAPQNGITVEIGGGSGNFKEFFPQALSTDVEYFPWLDRIMDAHAMTFAPETVANIVMVDVVHHLNHPLRFFEEAVRVLQPGGRILMLEPFPSLVSLPVYKLFHPEPFLMHEDYFSHAHFVDHEKDPWESNQAIPYLLFFKHRDKFEKMFRKHLTMRTAKKMSFVLYPLSGGFERSSLIPEKFVPFVQRIERLMTPCAGLLAFRCYVVLERT